SVLIWRSGAKRAANEPAPPEAAAAPIAAAPIAAAPAEPREPAKLDRILLQITAEPANAKLFLDDDALPANPTSRAMVADGSRHLVRAEPPDYQSRSAPVVLDKDASITLKLEKSSKASSTPPSVAIAPRSHAAAATPPPEATPAPSPAPPPPASPGA